MKVAIELFLTGVALGTTQCALSCGPMLVFYVAGATKGWREGLKATLIFCFSRLSAYVLLGLLAGSLGKLIIDVLHGQFILYLSVAAGSFVAMLGVLMLWGKEPNIHACRVLSRHTIDNSTRSMALLGFVIGITPCGPLLGVLTFITWTAHDPLSGAFYALCFGIGASVITPLVIMGVFASVLSKLMLKAPKVYLWFRRACGLLLLFYGAQLIVQAFRGS